VKVRDKNMKNSEKNKKSVQKNREKKLKLAQVHNRGLKQLKKDLKKKETEDILSEHLFGLD